jgi:hypothetical protein
VTEKPAFYVGRARSVNIAGTALLVLYVAGLIPAGVLLALTFALSFFTQSSTDMSVAKALEAKRAAEDSRTSTG